MGEIERYYKDDFLTREREGVSIVIEHKSNTIYHAHIVAVLLERKRATVFKT